MATRVGKINILIEKHTLHSTTEQSGKGVFTLTCSRIHVSTQKFEESITDICTCFPESVAPTCTQHYKERARKGGGVLSHSFDSALVYSQYHIFTVAS